MKRLLLLAVLFAGPVPFAVAQPQPIVSGLRTPESVAVAADGKVYVTEIGEFNKDGDGAVVLIEGDKATPFVTGLNDPKGIVAHSRWLFVADKTRIVRIDVPTRKMDEFAPASAFPTPPQFLNDIAVDPGTGKKGTVLYVSDSGDLKGNGGAVYRVAEKGKISVVVDKNKMPSLHTPNGLALDGESFLLVLDFGTGILYRVKLTDGSAERLADGFGGGDGLAWDYNGRLFISDYKGGKIFGIARPGEKPVLVADRFKSAADICMSLDRKSILIPDMSAGTLTAVPAVVPGYEVDETPLDVSFEVCFPNLEWTGWKPETDDGKPNQLRLILLTHAGDGSNRVFVPTQQGIIHVFPNDQAAKRTEIFLDLSDRVRYDDRTNEEGFLGLAFHPKFKENGEFFVFYTPKYKNPKQMRNVVSRFRVSKSDPTKGDPASEEILMQFDKPFWNHDGGTICFGPDGYLYITHGDGGSGGDPHDNGQNLNSLLGKIHRIDVNKKADGKNYAIPPDNPFVGTKDARPEIFAYGFRNLWRMSFDRKTGDFWAGEVGQNLFEEIVRVQKGGNYGWRRRESLHPFGPTGVGVNDKMIEPIWEYHHEVGKSITGGHVYRGNRVPELDGHYIYGDYVTSKIWALKFDESKARVVANRPLKDPTKPVYSFGEDEKGELYLLTASINGKGIYWLKK